MDVWSETTAGTLVKASATTHITMRQNEKTSSWEVSVSASAAPAPFATGIVDKDTARTIRNQLALSMSTASSAEVPQVVVYDDEVLSVTSYTLAA